MIFVTGDCHGDFSKFNTTLFPKQKEMSKEDIVIITGDFGGIFAQENSKWYNTEQYWLKWLESKPFTTVFVDGNHENHKRLAACPVVEWHGGKAHQINSSVFHLMRGEIFEIEGKKIFAFGGASSHDISDGILDKDDPELKSKIKRLNAMGKYMYRIRDISWWAEELPKAEELENGLTSLAKHGNKVDYIISHCASTKVQSLISDMYEQDRLTDYFDKIRETVDYENWFFGHYHDNKKITEKDILLYEQIIKI